MYGLGAEGVERLEDDPARPGGFDDHGVPTGTNNPGS